jgi:hypothetical protein
LLITDEIEYRTGFALREFASLSGQRAKTLATRDTVLPAAI